MTPHMLLSAVGLLLTTGGAVLLYLASSHQRLMRTPPPARLLLSAGALLLVAGTACWVADWGGIVGGILALGTWMTASVALPYALARRTMR